MKFKPGAAIRTYKVKGREVVFRWPKIGDTKELLKYRNRLMSEDPPTQPNSFTRITLEKEKKYVKNIMKTIKEGKAVHPVIEVDGKVASIIHAKKTDPRSRIMNHVVELGLGLEKEFRGLGIGHLIMDVLEELSVKLLAAEILMLWCFETNKKALNLYRKHGFRVTGKVPKGIKHKGKYYNDILMCKVLR
jgi:RimJ/RimL family protein N-acetyltransferase